MTPIIYKIGTQLARGKTDKFIVEYRLDNHKGIVKCLCDLTCNCHCFNRDTIAHYGLCALCGCPVSELGWLSLFARSQMFDDSALDMIQAYLRPGESLPLL